MEPANENDPQDDAAIVRNPTHCTAPIFKEKLGNSPFLSGVGIMGEILLNRIKRPPATAATRCPWGVKNLSKRNDSTVPFFYRHLLMQEAEMIRNLNSPYIAGAVASDSLEECKRNLAIEYISIDLAGILEGRYKDNLGPLEAPKAIKASFAILNALDYLHTSVLMMHGDVKSFNVLVQGDFENVKVCGLGPTTKNLNPDGTMDKDSNPENETIGVGLWSAPEVFAKSSGEITSKADIFAFGLVVYEMLACMPPHTFPGIMDLVIAAPKEQKLQDRELKDCDDDIDEFDDGITHSKEETRKIPALLPKGKCFARKRQNVQNTVAGYAKEGADAIKKIKYDEVIIDLVDEEEPTKEEAFTDGTTGKENEPINNEGNTVQKDQNSGNVIKKDQVSSENAKDEENQALATSHTASATSANEATAASNEVTVVSSSESLQTVQDGNGKESEKPPAYLTNKAPEETPLKVESATKLDGQIAGNENRTEKPVALATKRPEDSSDVVMVIDSSDEENDAPNKAYEVNSSDSSINEYGSDDEEEHQYSEEYGETDEDYDGTDDILQNPEDDWDIDANFLNYGCLGTRPPIPSETAFGKEYNILLELFYVCTSKTVASRPSAAQILKALQDTKPDQP